jgi:predicted dehydrogenase
MDSRRNFLGKAAAGLAATLVPSGIMGANDRIRLGVIGPGFRGVQLMQLAMACPNNELVAFADIYTRRLQEAKAVKGVAPDAKTYLDYRHLLDDKSIDAVLIATPQHLHCEHFCAALDAGKHVYQEKTMAFTPEHAKRMRAAYQRAGKRTVQIGHQWCSGGWIEDAMSILKQKDWMGTITAIHGHMYRNTPHGRPQALWSRPILPDMTPENIIWRSFLGEAPPHDFDANRYLNWRLFFDYSGGNVFENMSHQIAFWYKALNLQIPKWATQSGGIYLWKDGREVPDTSNAAMEHPEGLLVSWDSGFGNSRLGCDEHVLGSDGTLTRYEQGIRYQPERVNRKDGQEVLGKLPAPPHAIMQNFLDCIRSGKETDCPFEIGFRVSIACRMVVESYRQSRTMRWDATREEIA